jgi:hypothetical protein
VKIARFALAKTLLIANSGLVVGAIAGWAGLLTGGTAAAVGTASIYGYPALVVVLPVVLVVETFFPLRRLLESPRPPPVSPVQLGALLVATAVASVILATVYFLVVATYIPTIFSLFRLDPIAVRAAMVSQFSWPSAWLLLGVTVMTSVGETAILRARVRGRS